MHRVAILVFLVLVGLLIFLVWAATPSSVSSCQVISSPGEYSLSQDINDPPSIDASPLGGKACIKIISNDVMLDCKNFWINTTPQVGSNYTYGVIIDSASNVTVKNCVIGNYQFGLYAKDSSNSLFNDNIFRENTNTSIIVDGGDSNTFDSNSISNPYHTCVWIDSDQNQFLNNYLYNCTFYSMISLSGSNSFISNTVNQLGSPIESVQGILLFAPSHDNIVKSNTLFGGSARIDVVSNGNIVEGNTIHDSTGGIGVAGSSTNNIIKNNTVYNSEASGIGLGDSCYDNLVTGNTVFGNEIGIELSYSLGNTISMNTVYGNNPNDLTSILGIPYGGIAVIGIGNNITQNDVYENKGYGIGIATHVLIGESSRNSVTSNNIHDNSAYGIYLDESNNNHLSNNEIYDQRTGNGTMIIGSTDTVLDNEHFYNNNQDFSITAYDKTIDVTFNKVIFDSPAGNYDEFTNISLSDTLTGTEYYSIKWARTSSSPSGFVNLNKAVDITSASPSLNIDEMTWYWADSDITGADENSIRLLAYNTGWNPVNGFNNPSTNSLKVNNANAGLYGLFINPPQQPCTHVNISINFTPSCDRNEINVSAGGSPLEEANVAVEREGYDSISGTTDSAGTFLFNLTGQSADIYVSKDRTGNTCYTVPSPGYFTVNLTSHEDCNITGCTSNADCETGFDCINSTCTAINATQCKNDSDCGPGKVCFTNGMCIIFANATECTKDSECGQGKVCTDNECVPKQNITAMGCTYDADCSAEQYCSAGTCTEVLRGSCGHIVNHAWVKYACCADADCVSGKVCLNNACTQQLVSTVVWELSGPTTTVIGNSVTFRAYSNSQLTSNADIKVVRPNGRVDYLRTDATGSVTLSINETGAYAISLLSKNTTKKTIFLTSSQKAPVTSPGTQATGKPDIFMGIVGIGLFLLLIIITIAVIIFLIYYITERRKRIRRNKRRRR